MHIILIGNYRNFRIARKGSTGFSEPEEFYLFLDYILGEGTMNLFNGQVGSVNLFMAPLTCFCNRLVIIFPREQIEIPHLRFTGHE